jgi:Zn-dependent peptidase ImmA (M78 family)/transcriptional regulator with XRE-family HTH domain
MPAEEQMAVTREELGTRLRSSREASGLTQAEVAARVGLSRPAVAEIEAGRRGVSGLELDRLAYLFGRDIREFLRPAFDAEDVLAAVFRAAPDLAEDDLAGSLRDAIRLGRELSALEASLGLSGADVIAPAFPAVVPRNRWDAVQQGERAAAEERRRLDLGTGPIDDVAELLAGQGVRAVCIDLPADVSGMTLRLRDAGLLVVVNRDHAWTRRRFSWAHELAHVRLDPDLLNQVSRGSERDDLREVRANAFAAAFLLPEEGARQFVERLGKGEPSRARARLFDESGALDIEARASPGSQRIQLYDVVLLAHHFKVSRMAAVYRLLNLKLLTQTELDELRAMEDAGAGKRLQDLLHLPASDPAALGEEFHHRFLGLALEAYRRELITRGKLLELARLVGVEREEVLELLDQAGLLAETFGPEVLLPEA